MKSKSEMQRKLLLVVMDGIGERAESFGNAVKLAHTPVMDYLKREALFMTLKAHGKAVGLPSDSDMGNSEVGHNTLGAGRAFEQGAKLIESALASEEMYKGAAWRSLIQNVKDNKSTLHFLGLLSDGNVHSHCRHLYHMLRQAKKELISKVRIHILFDGRDVANPSAEKYVQELEVVLTELNDVAFDAKIASGGGRMLITMDRYNADWAMVERGWKTHVLGLAESFPSAVAALAEFRSRGIKDDQYLAPFVVAKNQQALGPVLDGDSVVLFNFRGDRAIEISQAFENVDFKYFERGRVPKICFAGMMQYDGDLKIPQRYLVEPPQIRGVLSEYLLAEKVRQFACSETQKYGHVTYFWNGNKSGYLNKKYEEYLEIPSDNIVFNARPWMKAEEITQATIKRIESGAFDFGRINFANGDMVGHTGDLEAATIAVATVDLMLGRLYTACLKHGVMLLVTADHGNCDEMFEINALDKFPQWDKWPISQRPSAKTSHTLSAVPFYFFDPINRFVINKKLSEEVSIANIAACCVTALGLKANKDYQPSLIAEK
ncbi:MAG: 2,3-bisphosphoglycerate-independent phosphoglycerate mutase [Oligoflexales bacterium]|nr:2,3-bisphosphoglycerate-independent phosphoglycerate mutase [Oligoflexales bacterium]